MKNFIESLCRLRSKISWIALFLLRIATGAFFAISGYFKLFDPMTHKILLKTLMDAGIPFPHFNAIFVPAVEFIGGLLLIIGLATSIVALILAFLLLIAIVTDAIFKIPANLGFFAWLSYFLYLPEVLFEFLLLCLILQGAGKFSIDNLLCRHWKRQ